MTARRIEAQSDMTPWLGGVPNAQDYSVDGGGADAAQKSNLGNGQTKGARFPYNLDLFSGEFRLCGAHAPRITPMRELVLFVLFRRHPLQVIECGIEAVAIKVSAHVTQRRWSAKRFEYKSMDKSRRGLTRIENLNRRIFPANEWPQDIALAAVAYLAGSGSLIARKARDWLPIFHENKVAQTYGRPQG
jgi:hypothetical protein